MMKKNCFSHFPMTAPIKMVDSLYFVKSTPLRASTGYVADILKMCMNKFDAEKIFLTNLQGF